MPSYVTRCLVKHDDKTDAYYACIEQATSGPEGSLFGLIVVMAVVGFALFVLIGWMLGALWPFKGSDIP